MIQNQQQQAMQNFEIDLKKHLAAAPFPSDRIEMGFHATARAALIGTSAMDMKCEFSMYENIVKRLTADPAEVPEPWDLFTISFVLNTIETRSPAELKLSLADYLVEITNTRAMARLWNELAEPIKNKLKEKHMPKNPAQSNMKVVPPNQRSKNGKQR
jgi:hypothetical protein